MTLIEPSRSSGRRSYLTCRLQRVADTVHGADQLGAELAAQRRARASRRCACPRRRASPTPRRAAASRREHGAGPGGEAGEEVELGRRQVHLVVADRHPPLRAVDLAGRRRDRRRPGAAVGAGRALDPPQQHPDPGHELARRERLGHVVVGADAEPDEQVGLVVAGGEHQHRAPGGRPAAPAHLEAVEAGQHQVEHDEVRVAGRGAPRRRRPARRRPPRPRSPRPAAARRRRRRWSARPRRRGRGVAGSRRRD